MTDSFTALLVPQVLTLCSQKLLPESQAPWSSRRTSWCLSGVGVTALHPYPHPYPHAKTGTTASASDPSVAKVWGNLLRTPTAKGQRHKLVTGSTQLNPVTTCATLLWWTTVWLARSTIAPCLLCLQKDTQRHGDGMSTILISFLRHEMCSFAPAKIWPTR